MASIRRDDTTAGTPGDSNEPAGVVLDSDGRILVGLRSRGLTLARYDPDGSLDATFGTGGIVRSDPATLLADVARSSNGKILALGTKHDGANDQRWLIARFDERGASDPSFGENGAVAIDPAPTTSTFPHDLLVQADGRIVAIGSDSYNLIAVRFLGGSPSPCRRPLPTRHGATSAVGTAGDLADPCAGSARPPAAAARGDRRRIAIHGDHPTPGVVSAGR